MTGTDLLARADRLRTQRTPFVLATVVRAERPTSAKAGDRAILLADGSMEGFVGGTCAESTVRVEGLRLLDDGEAPGVLLRITPEGESPVATPAPEGLMVVANPCLSGGTLDIFLEPVRPATMLYVFGAAPIARALVAVAEAAGYDVMASQNPADPVPEGAAAVVIASHGRDEERVLDAALRAGVPYVGLVASRRRGSAVVSSLDIPDELKERVRTPAGLDIGAHTPNEIAVSVLAELISVQPRVAIPVLESTATPSTAIDPVCGMTVAAVPASLHLEHDGRTWYFCGPGCKQAFADDPGRYA
jgi:xanthine dehydrogenase accessory factor